MSIVAVIALGFGLQIHQGIEVWGVIFVLFGFLCGCVFLPVVVWRILNPARRTTLSRAAAIADEHRTFTLLQVLGR